MIARFAPAVDVARVKLVPVAATRVGLLSRGLRDGTRLHAPARLDLPGRRVRAPGVVVTRCGGAESGDERVRRRSPPPRRRPRSRLRRTPRRRGTRKSHACLRARVRHRLGHQSVGSGVGSGVGSDGGSELTVMLRMPKQLLTAGTYTSMYTSPPGSTSTKVLFTQDDSPGIVILPDSIPLRPGRGVAERAVGCDHASGQPHGVCITPVLRVRFDRDVQEIAATDPCHGVDGKQRTALMLHMTSATASEVRPGRKEFAHVTATHLGPGVVDFLGVPRGLERRGVEPGLGVGSGVGLVSVLGAPRRYPFTPRTSTP